MATVRPRVTCPDCGRNVALTPTGRIGWHMDRTGASDGYYYCDGYGQFAGDVAAAQLDRLAVLVERYPERARELVAGL